LRAAKPPLLLLPASAALGGVHPVCLAHWIPRAGGSSEHRRARKSLHSGLRKIFLGVVA
jgi:hypothetical protein